ncbi:MAG TPA: hypothetical protein ENK23_07235, partial [Sorangium sp.]|nr:hypothetical protein [Sorangium sp.]
MSSFNDDNRRHGGIPRTGNPGGWPGNPGGLARPQGRGAATSQNSAGGSGAGRAGFPHERPSFQTPRTHQEQFALRTQQQAQAQQGQSQAPHADGPIARVNPAQGITPVQAPAPSMPKGGGAISAIAEKVSINPATGTTSYAVPLPLPPGRGGFGPQLSLQYSSGAGNGPFGLGWSVAVPSIGRGSSKALPQYRDDRDSDTFVMSGAEDLVPMLVASGGSGSVTWTRDVVTVGSERRERFRPRIEAPGSYARIERITDSADGNVFWRTTTANNITNTYGKSAAEIGRA